MGVDKSDVLKKMREAEAIYVLMSDCTRMPFVVCDPETYDDQVLIFFSEEEAMKGGQEFLKEGNPLKIFNIENKYMLSFYSSLFPAGVNGMWVGKDTEEEIKLQLTELVRRPEQKPVRVGTDISNAVQVAGGGKSGSDDWHVNSIGNTGYTYILKEDGTVSSLGYNVNGELGNGAKVSTTAVQEVSNLTKIMQVAGSKNGNFGAAVKEDGTVWTWGVNTYGQLGNGTQDTPKTKAIQVGGSSSNTMKLRNGAVLENDGVTIAKDKNGQELIYNENNELITTVYIEENQKFRIDSDIQVEKSFSLHKANAKVDPKDLTYEVFDESFATVTKDSKGNGIVTPVGNKYGVAIVLVKDNKLGYGSIVRVVIRPKDAVAMPMIAAGNANDGCAALAEKVAGSADNWLWI